MKNEILEEKKQFLKKCRKFRFFAKQQRGDERKFFKNCRFFRQTLQGQKNRKYKPNDSLISMYGKLKYCRVVLCETPHEKRAIRREIAISVKCRKRQFFPKKQRGDQRKFFKNGRFFRQTLEEKKNNKYKSYDSLISMDRKLNYCRVVLCETPHEKQAIRREIAIAVVSKMAIFRKTAKGTNGNFSKMADFLGKLYKFKKKGNKNRMIA